MGVSKPWLLEDELWDLVEPLIPVPPRRVRNPGRKRLPDRECLQGILFVLHTGIGWEHLPQELGFGSGMTCWRRLRDWNDAGVWQRLHEVMLADLQEANRIDWSRAVVDSTHVRALKGGPTQGRARSTDANRAPNTT
jgi:transposase